MFEFSEFVVDVLGITDLSPHLDADKAARPRSVTYHETCHLRRELGATTQARTLIRSLNPVGAGFMPAQQRGGVELVEMRQSEVCCGFGGTFAVKYPEISGAMLQDKLDNIRDTGADAVVACDSSCLMHVGGGMERQGMAARPLHLAQLIDESMRGR